MSFIGESSVCKNCGQEITYCYGGTSGSDMWLHKWDRWEYDNGYWCYCIPIDGKMTCAEPKEKDNESIRRH